MADFVYPARNLPGLAEDWGRAVEARDKTLDRDITQLSQSVNNSQRATGGQLAVIAAQLDSISDSVIRLRDIANVQESESGTGSNGATWYANPPSVTLTSVSGRFEVGIFGTAAGVMSLYSFSCPGYARERIVGDSTSARVSRVSAAGGVSAAITAFGSWIVTPNAPPGSPVTFSAEALGTSEFSSTLALKIQVRPAL